MFNTFWVSIIVIIVILYMLYIELGDAVYSGIGIIVKKNTLNYYYFIKFFINIKFGSIVFYMIIAGFLQYFIALFMK